MTCQTFFQLDFISTLVRYESTPKKTLKSITFQKNLEENSKNLFFLINVSLPAISV